MAKKRSANIEAALEAGKAGPQKARRRGAMIRKIKRKFAPLGEMRFKKMHKRPWSMGPTAQMLRRLKKKRTGVE